MSQLIRIAVTGTVFAGEGFLKSATFTAVGGAGTVAIRTGGASGTIILTLSAASGESVQATFCGAQFENLHATITNGEVACEV